MHDLVENSLEEILAGSPRRDLQTHLAGCEGCRKEVAELQSVSELFAVLKTADSPEPAPGFYALVSRRIEARKASQWSILSLDAVFGRRLAFASLMVLAVLGGFLVSQESNGAPESAGPEGAIATHDSSTVHEAGSDRDRMMLTLATYDR